MSKYRTIDVWNEFYGRKESVYDYAGRLMKKSACGESLALRQRQADENKSDSV